MTTTGNTNRKGKGQRGGGRTPVDSKTREVVVALARGGKSRNAIAREVGISASTVTRICSLAEPPITFDRAATKAATEAKSVDHKARRQAISEGLLDDIDKIRGMLFTPIERHHFSVTNGDETYEALPTSGEIKDLFIAAGIAIDKHIVLSRHDSDDRDLSSVDAWLLHITSAQKVDVPAGWE